MKRLKYLFFFLFVLAIGASLSSKDHDNKSQTAPAPVARKKTDAEVKREAGINRAVSAVMTIRQIIRNPDSLVVEKVLLMDSGSVCLNVRGQNGFGGVNKMSAVAFGDDMRTSEMSGFTQRWNKDCANKSGEDVTEYAKSMAKILE